MLFSKFSCAITFIDTVIVTHVGFNLTGATASSPYDEETREEDPLGRPALSSPLSDESETASMNSLSMKQETAGSAQLPVPPARGILKGIVFSL